MRRAEEGKQVPKELGAKQKPVGIKEEGKALHGIIQLISNTTRTYVFREYLKKAKCRL
jgi:hypothetical protein